MAQAANSQKTILLLDDEEIDRSTARQILTGQNYAVLEADCYKSALSLFEKRSDAVDLLIADIALPDGNGCELSLNLRELKPDLRVLFVSGHVGAEVCRFYGLDATDLHFLRKPFEAAELMRSVQRVLKAANPFPRLFPRTRTA